MLIFASDIYEIIISSILIAARNMGRVKSLFLTQFYSLHLIL